MLFFFFFGTFGWCLGAARSSLEEDEEEDEEEEGAGTDSDAGTLSSSAAIRRAYRDRQCNEMPADGRVEFASWSSLHYWSSAVVS